MRASEALRFAAVRLFEERAGAVGSGFTLVDDNAPVVASICRALDGIPLAIEMAAPRLKVMSLEQLSGGLDQRFRLLNRGNCTALPRHQTLHALIGWSYELLSPAERILLRQLSVFAGPTTLKSIEAVVTVDEITRHDVIDLLSSLVDKSLVVADTTRTEPRYRLLESTRHFAREKLAQSGELGRVTARHAEHCAALLREASAA